MGHAYLEAFVLDIQYKCYDILFKSELKMKPIF